MDPVGDNEMSPELLHQLGFDLHLVIDPGAQTIVGLNHEAAEALQLSPLEAGTSVPIRQVLSERSATRLLDVVEPLLAEGDTWTGTVHCLRPTERPQQLRAFAIGKNPLAGGCERIELFARATQNPEQLLQELAHRATHDPLTGLPNRVLLLDRLQQILARSRRDRTLTAVMFIDLDQFKLVNDHHGHATGDLVLAAVAKRMRAALRPSDTLARLSGDEFVAVCPDVGSVETANAVAQRLRSAVPELSGPGARLSASVGVAVGDSVSDAIDGAATLLRSADHAMYVAKRRRVRSESVDQLSDTYPETSQDPVSPTPATAQPADHGASATATATGGAGASVQRVPSPAPQQIPARPAVPTGSSTTATTSSNVHSWHRLGFDPVVELNTGTIVQFHARAYSRAEPPASTAAAAATDTNRTDANNVAQAIVDECFELASELADQRGAAAPTVAIPISEPTMDAALLRIAENTASCPWVAPNAICVNLDESLASALERLSLPTLLQLSASGVPVVVDEYSLRETTPDNLLSFSARMVRTPLLARSHDFPDGPPDNNVQAFRTLLNSAARTNTTVVATRVSSAADVQRAWLLGCIYGQGPHFGQYLTEAECLSLVSSPTR